MNNRKAAAEAAMSEATKIAMRETFARISTLPPDQIIPYLTNVVQIGFELLRTASRWRKTRRLCGRAS